MPVYCTTITGNLIFKITCCLGINNSNIYQFTIRTYPSDCTTINRRRSLFNCDINDRNIIKKLIDNQLGSQGWCDNATGLLVITSNQTYFGGTYERHEALIDGGLYAMNIVWGLHLLRIGSCFKMFVREPEREKRFKKIAGIPYNEIPVVLILCGHYKNVGVLEPKSVRL